MLGSSFKLVFSMNVQIRFQCFGDGVILPIWEPPPEPAEPAPRRGTKVRGDEARAAIGDDSESSARIAWESVDAERVNRLLTPWAERRRIQKLTERYQAKAKQDKQKKARPDEKATAGDRET